MKYPYNIMVIVFLLLIWICILVYVVSRDNDQPKKQPQPISYHIVVAKYKENITWLFHMDFDKLYVYDKSGDEYTPFISLKNKGREGGTFLEHIIIHYDHLPDYLILLQGNPFPHMRPDVNPRNLQKKITNLIHKKPTGSQPLLCDWYVEPLSVYPELMMDRYYGLMFEGKLNGTTRFAPGNQYLLSKKDILKRPKHFYQKLWNMAIKGDHFTVYEACYTKKKFDPSEIMGWSVERIFPIIFSDVPIKKSFLKE